MAVLLSNRRRPVAFRRRQRARHNRAAYPDEGASPVLSQFMPDQAYVVKDNVGYKLYYPGNDFASINFAQSPDGQNRTPYSGNPIISDAQYHSNVKYYATGFTGANVGTDPSTSTMHYRM